MHTVNQQLINLYQTYWENLKLQSPKFNDRKIKPASPLLIQVDEDKFHSADIKIMYCGQETKGWGSLENSTIEERLARYRKYFLESSYIKESSTSVYWKGVKRFQSFFEKELEGKKIVNIWNNISKIGLKQRKGMTDDIRNLEREYFPVFRKEFEILKPDIVIFMTGPNRDKDIKFHFPELKIQNSDTIQTKRQLAVLNLPKPLGIAIRTYHPNYFGGFNQAIEDAKTVLARHCNSNNA
jgi:hypothetical protein